MELPRDAEVAAKRAIYADAEPRDLAYKVARDIIERAHAGDQRFSRGDGVAILLMSWNAGFYRFRPALGRNLVADLNELISVHDASLAAFRARSAASYDPETDGDGVERLYRAFVRILWPVGTAKSLHVLAPLETQEDAEDVAASEDALAEYGGTGDIDADSYFRRLVAEGRVEYGAKPEG